MLKSAVPADPSEAPEKEEPQIPTVPRVKPTGSPRRMSTKVSVVGELNVLSALTDVLQLAHDPCLFAGTALNREAAVDLLSTKAREIAQRADDRHRRAYARSATSSQSVKRRDAFRTGFPK